jgi:hypothetical protein
MEKDEGKGMKNREVKKEEGNGKMRKEEEEYKNR